LKKKSLLSASWGGGTNRKDGLKRTDVVAPVGQKEGSGKKIREQTLGDLQGWSKSKGADAGRSKSGLELHSVQRKKRGGGKKKDRRKVQNAGEGVLRTNVDDQRPKRDGRE